MNFKIRFILRFVGLELLALALFLYWFVKGDYDRYLWIISGPFPFSHMGGASFQVVVYGGLVLVGVFLLMLSYYKNK